MLIALTDGCDWLRIGLEELSNVAMLTELHPAVVVAPTLAKSACSHDGSSQEPS